MEQILLFAALGVGAGAMIAGIAIGLVVTYRGSGTINLALGAVAMVAAYAFWGLKVGKFGPAVPTVPACVITIAVVLLLGVLMELLAFRPLRAATPVAKLVASLGILLIIQSAMTLAFGPYPQEAPSLLPSGSVSLFGGSVPSAGLVIAAVVIVMAAGLAALYRWSSFGLATRAAAENEVSGMLIGLTPNTLAMANTLVACLVLGILGVLIGPLTALDPSSMPLLVIPALAAALFAGFTSLGVACAVAIGIGAAENILYYVSTLSWFPTVGGVPIPGVEQLLEFLLVVVALFFRGARLPGRSALIERQLPAVPMPTRVVRATLILAAVAAVGLVVLPFDFRRALVTTEVAAVLFLSVVVITGFVGQISVVQLSLSGVAAFAMAHLGTAWHLGFPLAPLLGAAVATVVGLGVGVSALRVRGVQLAVVTLAAAVAIQQFWFANPNWGASDSGQPVPQPHLFGINFGNYASFRGLDGELPSPMLGFLILAVAVVLALFVANLRRTNLGQRMLAVRSNERAAAGAGISVRNVKLVGFAISSFIAGIAGAMSAYNYGSVSASSYDAFTALGVIAFAYIGGITMVSGAVIAALISTEAIVPHFLDRYLGISGTWALLIGGVLLIVNLVFYPAGVAGALRRGKRDGTTQSGNRLGTPHRGPTAERSPAGGAPTQPGPLARSNA
jgi:branched-chain amino acid transport system permease protein